MTEFTTNNEIAIEASYLYCFCISILLKGGLNGYEAYYKTFEEAHRRARVTGCSYIYYWIVNDIEIDDIEEMPKMHYRPIAYLKTSLLWAFYYLKK